MGPTVPTVAHTHIPKCHPHPFYFFAIVAPRPRTSLHVFNAQTPSSLFFFVSFAFGTTHSLSHPLPHARLLPQQSNSKFRILAHVHLCTHNTFTNHHHFV